MKLPRLYEAVRRNLAALKDLVEIKEVRDKAIGLEGYAKAAKDGALMAEAVRVRKWSTRRVGEAMEEKREAGEMARPGDYRKRGIGNPVPTLAAQGVDKNLAKLARIAAAMDEDKFRQAVEHAIAIAVAAIDGSSEVIRAARDERHQQKVKLRHAREQKLAGKLAALPQKRYGVILADPEWRFETWSPRGLDNSSPDNHYPTSALDEIKRRDVASIAAADCVLFLWATAPMAPQALEVMTAWGFAYKSQAVWIKDKAGAGYWFRNKHEILLVGTRGAPPAPAEGAQWASVIDAPVGKHSEKPEIFHELIEAYFPRLPKIELNARARRPGWDAWGLEAPEQAAA